MPLEHNTVRFVDNFSAGTRGSASAEYFLDHDYAVIFMHRHKSLEPFTRHFTGQQFFDMLDIADNSLSSTIAIKPDSVDVFAPVLAKYKIARETQMILYVNFTSVVDYMWLLRAACECLAAFEERAVLYLAAAVSDFYIPEDMMVSWHSPYSLAHCLSHSAVSPCHVGNLVIDCTRQLLAVEWLRCQFKSCLEIAFYRFAMLIGLHLRSWYTSASCTYSSCTPSVYISSSTYTSSTSTSSCTAARIASLHQIDVSSAAIPVPAPEPATVSVPAPEAA